MRLVAMAASILALALYAALMYRNPVYTLWAPRGGAFTLSVALAFANLLIWLSGQDHRPLSGRFQFAVAGWIWMLVQVIGLLYELHIPSA